MATNEFEQMLMRFSNVLPAGLCLNVLRHSAAYGGQAFSIILSRRVHGSPIGGTTAVSLKQGLGLMDISRGCPGPGRRPARS